MRRLTIVVVAIVASGLLLLGYKAWVATHAEMQLQSVIVCDEVIATFVKREGRLPSSWTELRATRPEHANASYLFLWPQDEESVRRYVDVAFNLPRSAINCDNLVGTFIVARDHEYYDYRKYTRRLCDAIMGIEE